jgi:hypothetical protein
LIQFSSETAFGDIREIRFRGSVAKPMIFQAYLLTSNRQGREELNGGSCFGEWGPRERAWDLVM